MKETPIEMLNTRKGTLGDFQLKDTLFDRFV